MPIKARERKGLLEIILKGKSANYDKTSTFNMIQSQREVLKSTPTAIKSRLLNRALDFFSLSSL
jgi:hypothetical protein